MDNFSVSTFACQMNVNLDPRACAQRDSRRDQRSMEIDDDGFTLACHIFPGPEKTIKVGLIRHKAQHYIVKTKIEGPAGVVASLIGKQLPDIHVWLVKSEAPTFVEFEGTSLRTAPSGGSK